MKMWTDWSFWHVVFDAIVYTTWPAMFWIQHMMTKRVERLRKHIFGEDYEG